MKVLNPADGKVIADLKSDTLKSIQNRLTVLRLGQPKWVKVPLEKRISIIQKFAQLLADNIEECANVLTSEVGKPLQQSRNEINGARGRIKWLCENASKYLCEEIMHQEEGLSEKIVYEPLGVVCNISAWNYPYNVGVNVFIPALLAGNAVMYKPSEHATLTGLMIEKFLKKAGIPDNVFHVVIGAKEAGEALLKMPMDGYFFTGSYKTGHYIYQKVAAKMVPCQLELGGKDPVYIAEDVKDIKAVAAGTADGAFYNTGQSCCSVERIYVHMKVYDKYVQEFVKEVRGYKVGQPTEDGVYIGPTTRSEQLDVLEAQVKDALKKGAKLLAGGKRMAGKGNYYEPTVLVNVTNKMRVMQEESFGPIIGIMKVKNDEEAITMMQDTEYGLTSAVYTSSDKRAEKILQQMNTGTVYINCCDRVSASLPWSGRGHSGFGSTLSHAGLRAFTKPKAYHKK